jgi:glycosyltransferase involved in cell wall biosynthesis
MSAPAERGAGASHAPAGASHAVAGASDAPAGVSRAPGLSPSWWERRERLQQEALPDGRVVVTCPAPYGAGGLGRHLHEIVAALQRRGADALRVCLDDLAPGRGRDGAAARRLARIAPLARFSPSARMLIASALFDARVAGRLPAAEHLIAFNGTALAQFRAAGDAGVQSLSLMSANSHMRKVIAQHELAHRQYPLERPWASRLLRRNLAEYALAQRIYASSEYVRDSFLEEGFAAERLASFPLTPDRRYGAAHARRPADTFDVVFVGSLLVHKGVPLLIDAFSRLPHADMRLVLVGGWKTRALRRFVERARARDERIAVSPGDPLPHVLRAGLCAHPSYEDGFAYAPAEALACGVPVLVSQDTGMKELIESESQGLVLPTGSVDALAEAIDAAYRREGPLGR